MSSLYPDFMKMGMLEKSLFKNPVENVTEIVGSYRKIGCEGKK